MSGPQSVDADHPSPWFPLLFQKFARSSRGRRPRLVRQPFPRIPYRPAGEYTAAGLRARSHRTHVLALRDPPAAPLLTADTHDASPARAVSLVSEADALVVATPTSKAACSGLLKTFLDLLSQHAFAGKPVLPPATGGSPAHVLALDHTLRLVLTSLGAQVTRGRFVPDRRITTTPDGAMTLDSEGERQLARITDRFARALPSRTPLAAA